MRLAQCFCFLSTLVVSILANEYEDDPYLAYRPAFARSLPFQILLTGVVLTLTAVLLIHLLFTAQYHWPLAPVNYVLQLSGVTTLLISLIATIHVVLSATLSESIKWPYMLSYIAVNVPPLNLEPDGEGWSVSEKATWLLMTASTSGLIQITHIQFLTLLYPSKLEGRLIFTLLGPLAIVAAVMQLLPISNNPNVNNISSAVRNVCNATLSLLFTIALFVWGFLVNRQQAWRTDGGTAVFGTAALFLAVVSTALNFLYVHKEEEFVWLPTLVWAVVLWQSFLGWWWWVGAGSGGGLTGKYEDMEERLKRRAKRETRRKEAEERRQKRKIKAQQVWHDVTSALNPHSSPAGLSNSVEIIRTNGDHQPYQSDDVGESTTPQRRRRRRRLSSSPHDSDEAVGEQGAAAAIHPSLDPTRTVYSSHDTSSGTAITAPRFIPDLVFRWYKSLRRAHIDAARLQAAETAERMRGIGQERERVVVGGGGGGGGGGDTVTHDDDRTGVGVGGAGGAGGGAGSRCDWFPWRTTRTTSERRNNEEDDEEHGGEDGVYMSEDNGYEMQDRRRRQRRRTRTRTHSEEAAVRTNHRPNSVWWWGPLERWRLQDSTSYS